MLRSIARTLASTGRAPRNRRARSIRPTLESCERRELLSTLAPGRVAGRVAAGGGGRPVSVAVGFSASGQYTPIALTVVTTQINASGSGQGTGFLRTFQFTSSQFNNAPFAPATDPIAIDQGTMTLTLRGGNSINLQFTGTATNGSNGMQYQELAYSVVGGTGRFRNAAGSLTGRAVLNPGPATPTLPAFGMNVLAFGSIQVPPPARR